MAANAMPPKPQNASVRNSRRVRGGLGGAVIGGSFHGEEKVRQEDGEREFAQGAVLKILTSGLSLGWIGVAAERELEDAADLAVVRGTGFTYDAFGERARHRVGEVAVEQLERLRRVRALFTAG